MTRLIEEVLKIAQDQVGVREQPLGSNRGPEVDEYVKSVGLDPEGHYPWCAGFVFWCFWGGAIDSKERNGCPKTGSALGLWAKASEGQRVRAGQKIVPGMVFVLDLGHGAGHVGFITSEQKPDGSFETIEGNSNLAGQREGIGVFARTRTFGASLKGFLDFSGEKS